MFETEFKESEKEIATGGPVRIGQVYASENYLYSILDFDYETKKFLCLCSDGSVEHWTESLIRLEEFVSETFKITIEY